MQIMPAAGVCLGGRDPRLDAQRTRAGPGGRRPDLRRHRAGHVRRCVDRGAGSPGCDCSPCRIAERGDPLGRPQGLAGGARPLPADRGLSLRQPDRRRLGGPGERLAARRGPDRLCRRQLRRRVRREPPVHRQRDRQPNDHGGDPAIDAQVRAGFEGAIGAAVAVPMPLADAVGDPAVRPKIEALVEQLEALRALVRGPLASGLGLSIGFNATDGD